MRSLLLLGLLTFASTAARSSEWTASIDADAWVALVLAGHAGAAANVDAVRARAEVEAAGVWANPALRLERQSGPLFDQSKGSQDFLAIEVPLALSGRRGLQRDAAARRVDAADLDVRSRRARVAREALEVFVDVVVADRRRLTLDEERARLAPVVAAARRRADAGESPASTALRLELELARVDDAVAAAVADALTAHQRAEGLAGVAAPAFVDVLPSVAPAAPIATPAAVSALQHQAQAAALDEEAAGRRIFPDVVFGGGPSLLNSGSSAFAVGYLVTVGMELPIFDHGQGDIARARADRAAAEAERVVVVSRIAAARAQARVTADAARTRAAVFAVAVEHGAGLFDAAAKDLSVGSGDVVAFVDAAAALRDARLHLVSLQEHSARADADLSLENGALDSSPENQ